MKNFVLTKYIINGRVVYLWQYEDKDGSTKTMTLKQFDNHIKRKMKDKLLNLMNRDLDENGIEND